jgi:hypothetical protein
MSINMNMNMNMSDRSANNLVSKMLQIVKNINNKISEQHKKNQITYTIIKNSLLVLKKS